MTPTSRSEGTTKEEVLCAVFLVRALLAIDFEFRIYRHRRQILVSG
jgi:hypothetical protein